MWTDSETVWQTATSAQLIHVPVQVSLSLHFYLLY